MGKVVYAHRFAYESARGPLPPGMQIDHICNVRACVNTEHLQVVTPWENSLLAKIRSGDASVSYWDWALDVGLAVELKDKSPDERLSQKHTWGHEA